MHPMSMNDEYNSYVFSVRIVLWMNNNKLLWLALENPIFDGHNAQAHA